MELNGVRDLERGDDLEGGRNLDGGGWREGLGRIKGWSWAGEIEKQ